ncbi:MAG: hypothetical protein AB4050_08710 [Synechococcus sp.]
MLPALLLHFPVIAGLVVGLLTGLAIQRQTTFLQFVLAAIASLFVFISSLMYLSVMPDMMLNCEGWDCIELGKTFNVVGLLGASLTMLAIVVTEFSLRLLAYKEHNDRRYWTDEP